MTAVLCIVAFLVGLFGGLWLDRRAADVPAPAPDPDDTAQRLYEASHARWCADNEAYRWKRRALRLGWRREPGRWDR